MPHPIADPRFCNQAAGAVRSWIASSSTECGVIDGAALTNYLREALKIAEDPSISSADVSDANLAWLMLCREGRV